MHIIFRSPHIPIIASAFAVFLLSFKGDFSSKSSFFTLAVLIFKMKFPILSFVIGKNYWVMTGTKWNIISFQLHFPLKILNSPIFKSPPFLLYASPVRTPSSPIQINPWNTYLETLAPFPHLPLFNPHNFSDIAFLTSSLISPSGNLMVNTPLLGLWTFTAFVESFLKQFHDITLLHFS